LKRLCEVSRILNNLTVPYLYKDIVIKATDESYLEELDVEPFLRTCSKPISHLSYVKKIQVLSRFHHNLNRRCVHHRFEDMSLDEERDEEPNSFADLISNLMPLFRELKDGSLRSFRLGVFLIVSIHQSLLKFSSWELGTCVPLGILGRSGYLGNKQSSIETLSLITGGACGENMDGECPIDLSAFRSLRGISWINLRSAEDFEALGNVLQTNSAHLTELRIDFVDWIEAHNSWFADRERFEDNRSENFFAREVLKLSAGEVVVKFPALETLLLSDISFNSAAPEMFYAFNLSRLRSLTLRNCPGSGDFLRGAIELGEAIRLISLEVQANINHDFDIPGAISTFLRAFEGLENLYIAYTGPTDTIALWRSMLKHKSTLARFAYHQRVIDIDMDSPHYAEWCDLLDLSPYSDDVTELMANSLYHPFRELNLECIGLCFDAHYWV
jgi:hypothetical protein